MSFLCVAGTAQKNEESTGSILGDLMILKERAFYVTSLASVGALHEQWILVLSVERVNLCDGIPQVFKDTRADVTPIPYRC